MIDESEKKGDSKNCFGICNNYNKLLLELHISCTHPSGSERERARERERESESESVSERERESVCVREKTVQIYVCYIYL